MSESINNSIRTGDVLRPGEQLVSSDGRFHARFQSDGNFVVYRGREQNPKNAIWATGTYFGSEYESYELRLQADGNLALYGTKNNGDSSWTTRCLWASATAQRRTETRLELGNDGVLELTKTDGTLLWHNRSKLN